MTKNERSVIAACVLVAAAGAGAMAQPLGPAPVPPENPITEAKAVLGKILFFDEQMSSDNTMACATCHIPSAGGADPRRQRIPGPDGVMNTADDIFGSPGVVKSDELLNYVRDTVRGTATQVTGRTANPTINAAYFDNLFWDGRAKGRFVDPQTGEVAIESGGALESQAVGPPTSGVEMGHAGRDWNQITRKLATSRPLALATNLTPDIAAALTQYPTYPMLFEAAFGDGAISSKRVAFAIATYQRTLISDQTPFDRWLGGDEAAMTTNQINGWFAFNDANCAQCHVPPTFTDNNFRNIGVRPSAEDTGHMQVTGNPADAGKFKTSTLRNMALKSSFMHNGQMTNMLDVVRFYNGTSAAFPIFRDNLDPEMEFVSIPGSQQGMLVDFLLNGLTDPRVRAGTYPFDAVTLYSQRPADRPTVLGTGTAGTGNVMPQWIATMPALVGSSEFRLGVDRTVGGAAAVLVASPSAPVSNRLPGATVRAAVTASGAALAAGAGTATAFVPIPADRSLVGTSEYFQWIITDAAAAGGYAHSAPLRVTYICGSSGCAPGCLADIAKGGGEPGGDGQITGGDFVAFVTGFTQGAAISDIAGPGGEPVPDGTIDGDDFIAFINAFMAGC